MTDRRPRRLVLLAMFAAALLAGCASDPRFASGLDWVTAQEAERARLQAQGFPQYTGPN
jgi:type IV pilus biogenesis protein CpaD/CtpE